MKELIAKLSIPKNLALFCIVLGSILRMIFPFDFEYKDDQKIMLDWMIEFHHSGQFRDIGMMSGGHVYNFGLGVWLFYLIGYISLSPMGATMIVAIVNVISLFILYFIINKHIEEDEKSTWYHAISLLSISILPIVLSRNIWIQSILPPFVFAIIYLYITRANLFLRTAFLSFLLVIIGQIHLSGVFLCASMSILIAYYHFKNIRPVHLSGYIVGGILGALPMYSYINFIMNQEGSSSPNTSFSNLSDMRILWMHIFDGLGLDIFYSLEKYASLFLQYPRVLGHNTYLNGGVYFGIIVIAIYGLFKTIKSFDFRNFEFKKISLDKLNFSSQFILISMVLYAMLTMIGSKIYTHYFIITYPFIFILAIKLLNKTPKLIPVLIVFNLILAIQFMLFIHETGGFADSYYGLIYNLSPLK